MSWRLLDTPPLSGAVNMALDMALLERARATGETVLRTYRWTRPTLSLGRNQTARGHYDTALLASRGVDVVRRPTGGRAILHRRELTYSVTAPLDGMSSLRDDYWRINSLLVAALEALGVAAAVATSAAAVPPPDAHPCFAEPSPGEIVHDTRSGIGKLVGSAQYREEGALLQHGSVLLHDDQPLLLELAPGNGSSTSAASLSGVLGREVQYDEVRDALFQAVRSLVDPEAAAMDYESVIAAGAAYAARFENPLWTWRR